MPRVRLLTSVAGELGDYSSPSSGQVLDLPDSLAKIWADGERAEYVDPPKKRKKDESQELETASVAAPEAAVRPRGRPRKVR